MTATATTSGRNWLKPSLDWLLVFVPIAIAFRFVPALHKPTVLFVVSCLAIIPIAGWMGRATEHLAEHVGETAGGLLTSTFGNAAELIIALFALSKGLQGVVKASLTGSIIGNALLVFGVSVLAGGTKHGTQRFDRNAAGTRATALTLAAIALIMPTIFHIVAAQTPVAQGGWTPSKEQSLSLAIAVVMFLVYGFTVLYALLTNKKGVEQDFAAEVGHELTEAEDHGERWSVRKGLTVLTIATTFVALLAEFLTGAVEDARESFGLTEVFVGVIVVAIIGNAAENSSAILMAMRNKMDLSIGIALGSSLQIVLFVTPILVFASYFSGKPLNLEFTLPEVFAVAVSVLIVEQISSDGESNWMEGIQLLSVYAILGILFYFLPDAH